jgi:oxaloacetate decarboxylase gamma subunit
MSAFQAGLNVTAIGMGVVFVLLTLLVFVIQAMSALSLRIEGSMPQATPSGSAMAPAKTADQELISVISAAITAHRKKR